MQLCMTLTENLPVGHDAKMEMSMIQQNRSIILPIEMLYVVVQSQRRMKLKEFWTSTQPDKSEMSRRTSLQVFLQQTKDARDSYEEGVCC